MTSIDARHRLAALASAPALDARTLALVIAAREFWDIHNDLSDESRALDKALELFSALVPYAEEPASAPAGDGECVGYWWTHPDYPGEFHAEWEMTEGDREAGWTCQELYTRPALARPRAAVGERLREAVVTLDVFLSAYEDRGDAELVERDHNDDLLTYGHLRTILSALPLQSPPAKVEG